MRYEEFEKSDIVNEFEFISYRDEMREKNMPCREPCPPDYYAHKTKVFRVDFADGVMYIEYMDIDGRNYVWKFNIFNIDIIKGRIAESMGREGAKTYWKSLEKEQERRVKEMLEESKKAIYRDGGQTQVRV